MMSIMESVHKCIAVHVTRGSYVMGEVSAVEAVNIVGCLITQENK